MSLEVAVNPVPNQRGPHLAGATVVVIGYGRSGRAAANLLAEVGADVRVVDAKTAEALGVAPHDVPGGADWLGRMEPSVLRGADLVVASPGVRPDQPVLAAAIESSRPVHSELELGWWFTDAPTIAITGTNGKTTTTELVGAMGRAAGFETAVAGNVGTPVSELATQKPDLIVLEVSSFQLHLCRDFRPHVGACLNLTPDHLDWHPDFDHYAAAKRSLFERQGPQDAAVLNGDDPALADWLSESTAEAWEFRTSAPLEHGAWIRDERLMLRVGDEVESIMSLSEWMLPGRHNRENLLAAALCARLAGIPAEAVRSAAREFRGLAHRMEIVAREGDVTWINDSKSTNPGSLVSALDPDAPTLLIAGGVTKGVDFRPLRDAVAGGARVALLIGEGAADLEEAWRGAVETVVVGDVDAAVRWAARSAQPGERVLFSPGCASFDQFDHYVHRGNYFRDIVRKITTGGGVK